MRALILQSAAVIEIPLGIADTLLISWIAGRHWSVVAIIALGSISGTAGGIGLGMLINFAWSALAIWLGKAASTQSDDSSRSGG